MFSIIDMQFDSGDGENINPTKSWMKIKTNVIVGICVSIGIVQIYSMVFGVEVKDILNKITRIVINVTYLSISHFWILRSEEIYSYVKRKTKTLYSSRVEPY